MTFRVPPERRAAVRAVVGAIKRDAALGERLVRTLGAARRGGGGRAAPAPNTGPFRDAASALEFLVGRLAAALRPEAIYLFGSRAGGRARPDSDFDLLAVLPDSSGSKLDYFAARAPVAGLGIGVDVVPCPLADFLAERRKPGTVAHEAARTGRLLYARPGGALRQKPAGRGKRP
ncbi:MAG: nucleotidyltransferase domain-containing protein [Alphaproteobacteria bacterium]|nr:nucleotidyltransferase domain-containing protein [Alphaproteobacteria bacterium]